MELPNNKRFRDWIPTPGSQSSSVIRWRARATDRPKGRTNDLILALECPTASVGHGLPTSSFPAGLVPQASQATGPNVEVKPASQLSSTPLSPVLILKKTLLPPPCISPSSCSALSAINLIRQSSLWFRRGLQCRRKHEFQFHAASCRRPSRP